VAGPGGEQGYHCHLSRGLYWIGKDSGTVTYIGNLYIAARSGTDGWTSNYCHATGGAYFDPNNADQFYCAVTDNSSNRILLAIQYYGTNADIGPQSLSGALAECNIGKTNQPCFTFENITPASQNKSISQQVAAFDSEWSSSPITMRPWSLFGQQGGVLGLYTRSSDTNDVLGWFAMFRMSDRSIVAVAPTWKHWPFRWATMHGASPIGSADWMFFTGHVSIGSYSSTDAYGIGPWRTFITSGAVGTSGSACPARPEGSPISAADWPTGNNCIQITVRGEPCDPTPNGEPTNSSKCGAANDGYLMDAEVNDVFCGSNDPTVWGQHCGFFLQNEVFRLLIKNGTTWTMQRAYSHDVSAKPMLALNASAQLVAIPPSCDLVTYICTGAAGYWHFTADPYGMNTGGTGFVVDRANKGAGHGTTSSNG
jgi:hypothetical protein